MGKNTNNVSITPPSKNIPKLLSRGKLGALMVGGSLCVGSVIFALNTGAMEWSKALMQAKRDGVVIEPAPKLKTLLEKVATDLKLSNSEKKSVKLFCMESEIGDVFGTVKYPYGVLLGLPTTANAESVADYNLKIELEEGMDLIEMRNKIQKLKEVSVLSDAAKLFVIAEGLMLARDPYHIIAPAVSSSLCVIAAFLQGAFLVRRPNIPAHLRAAAQPLGFCASLVIWVAISVFIAERTKEHLIQKSIGQLSEEYIDGGIEFYEKLYVRQRLKRELFGVVLTNLFGTYYLDELIVKRLSSLRKLKQDSSWLC